MKEYTEEEIEAMKKGIDGMSQEDMASLWRFAPSGHPYFRSDLPLFEHFQKRFKGFTPELSKKIGWGD
jgi:hypothetical protein